MDHNKTDNKPHESAVLSLSLFIKWGLWKLIQLFWPITGPLLVVRNIPPPFKLNLISVTFRAQFFYFISISVS